MAGLASAVYSRPFLDRFHTMNLRDFGGKTGTEKKGGGRTGIVPVETTPVPLNSAQGNGIACFNADFDEALCLGHGNFSHKPNSDRPLYDPDVFRCMHPGGCNFLFADSSVHFLKTGMDGRTYQYLMTRAGGETISGDSY